MTKPFRSLGLVLAAGLLVTAGCCTKKPAPAPAPEVKVEPTPTPVPVPVEEPIAAPVAEPVAEALPADLEELNKKGYLKVAVMGCAVNGPGEARDADIGVAFGDGNGILFEHGEKVSHGTAEDIVEQLINRASEMLDEQKKA